MQSVLWGARRLREAGVPVPRREAEDLLAHVLSQPRHAWYLAPDAPLTADEAARMRSLVTSRADGDPLQYLLGTETFCGLEFDVTPDVLIPRPETEGVVEAARRFFAERRPAGASPAVVDVGTGSGCIALALARAVPDATVYATDCSRAALAVAARNAARLGVEDRVVFLAGDLLCPLQLAEARVDLIVSNPPYVADDEWPRLQREVRREPSLALRGGADGLDLYRRLVVEAGAVLRADGAMVLELGFGQEEAVGRLANAAGFDVERVDPDFQRIPRVMVLRAREVSRSIDVDRFAMPGRERDRLGCA
jgi:release factor glutamine methyltransferase